MRKIAIVNPKGGSGKTTTTVNVAAALAESGYRVLVIGLDPQCAATLWLGVGEATHGVVEAISRVARLDDLVTETTVSRVDLVPGSFDLATPQGVAEADIALGFMDAMDRLPARWDFVIVDGPASLGYAGMAPLTGCHEVLIPVEAHVLALGGLTALLDMIERIRGRLNPNLTLTAVLACRVNETRHTMAVVDALRRRFGSLMLQTEVRESPRLAEAPSFHLPITAYAPDSRAAADYRAVAAEIAAATAPMRQEGRSSAG